MTGNELAEALQRSRQIATTYDLDGRSVRGSHARAFGYLEQAVVQFLGLVEDRPAVQLPENGTHPLKAGK